MTPARAAELLSAVTNARVLVVGDLMMDRYVSGSVDRVSPEAPVPVVRVEEEWTAIGGAANVAANVVALGAKCTVVGCIGDDEAGRALLARLIALGISGEGVLATPDRPTTVKTRVMAGHHQIVRFDHEAEEDVGPRFADSLATKVSELAAQADIVVMEDYDKGVLAPHVIAAVLAAGSTYGVPTVVDPKRRHFFSYRGVTLFKPNAKELADALGEEIHPDEEGWMEATRRRIDCEYLLLTLGDRGVAMQGREGGLARVPTVARSVYDVSGAGDTVTSVVSTVLAVGGSAVEAAEIANHAAAVGVAKAGVATVSPVEIVKHIRDHEA